MVTRELMLAQTTTSIVSTSAEEGFAAALVEETLVAYPTLKVVTTQNSAYTSISETLVVT